MPEDSGIVTRTDYNPPAFTPVKILKYLVQVRRTQFCRSAGGLYLLCKPDTLHIQL